MLAASAFRLWAFSRRIVLRAFSSWPICVRLDGQRFGVRLEAGRVEY